VAKLGDAGAFAEARFQRLSTVAYLVAVSLTVIAFAGGAIVLGLDLWPGFVTSRGHRLVSALPLLAIATGYLVLQVRLRPGPHELLKRALLSIAFILWSASQLAPAAQWAMVSDDFAIALFVLDLGLVIWDELHHPQPR
jgi:hypothetical protein